MNIVYISGRSDKAIANREANHQLTGTYYLDYLNLMAQNATMVDFSHVAIAMRDATSMYCQILPDQMMAHHPHFHKFADIADCFDPETGTFKMGGMDRFSVTITDGKEGSGNIGLAIYLDKSALMRSIEQYVGTGIMGEEEGAQYIKDADELQEGPYLLLEAGIPRWSTVFKGLRDLSNPLRKVGRHEVPLTAVHGDEITQLIIKEQLKLTMTEKELERAAELVRKQTQWEPLA